MAGSHDDWDKRTLCSDGNCIGVIGADGRCKECGRAFDGDLPPAAAPDTHSDDADDGLVAPPVSTDDDDTDNVTAPAPEDRDDRWENRTLCIDESCIGVIGADGCCKECGKPYSG